ncbi:MAG: HAD family phosphatase [Clostridia bacterium]|nr:HAD family phosphatase [Clostridia bacterium]
MPKIKMIVTDLDGTYLNDGIASKENVRSVRLAQERGIKVMACTGRTWSMCRGTVPKLGFDELTVTSAGAAICNSVTGEPWYRLPLKDEWLEPLFDAAWASGCAFDVYCGPYIHTYAPRRSWWTRRSEQRSAALPEQDKTLFREFADKESWLEGTRGVAELFRVEVEPGGAYPPEMVKAVAKHGMGNNLSMSFKDHWDLTHPEADKGKAILIVCEHYGIAPDEMLALGDSNNDSSMLKVAGISAVMGDGAEDVKQLATVVTPTCAENGFAWAVHKFALGDTL